MLNKFKYLAGRVRWAVKNVGVRRTLTMARNWMVYPQMRRENRLNPRYRYDNVDLLLKNIDFSRNYELGENSSRTSRDYIQLSWIVSPFDVGSGGHQTIFRLIQYLSARGYKNVVYITDGHSFASEQEASDMIQNHFFKIDPLIVRFLREKDLVSGLAKVEDTDFVIATRYNTVYYAAMIKNCLKRFYFSQDFEPMFFPVGYQYVFAENSYKLGLHGICASPWLARLEAEYGMKTDHFYLGYDPKIYYDMGKERVPNSVAFYSRFESERRVVELGMLALEIVQKRIPDLKVFLYGSADSLRGYNLNFENRGVLKYPEMAELFNTAQVGLSFSLTNYGLTPTEMMGCGLPVVELKGDNTEAVFEHGKNIYLAERNPNAVANVVINLLGDQKLRSEIVEGGKEFVKDKEWEKIWSQTEQIFQREIKRFTESSEG